MIDKICLRHWQVPITTNMRIKGVGDCKKCTPHKDNKYCKMYYPITKLGEFKVKERN